MAMPDVHVPRGSTERLGRVEGRLEVASGATIRSAEGNLVVVTGEALFRGSASVDCDLECGSLTVEHGGKLAVSGNLTVNTRLDVSNAIEVGGSMKAEYVDVGGRVNARSVSCKRMRVGGTVEVSESLEADLVEVGRKIEAQGRLNVKELRVGGKAKVGGGEITGLINVGGKFESSSSLDFGELQVYGMSSLAGGSKGKKITASGKLEASGDLECDQIEIAGMAAVSGDCKTVRAYVKGKLEVEGSFTASELLDVYGATEVDGTFSGESLKVKGKFSAEKALVTNDAEIYGDLKTREGLRAKSVLIGTGTRCAGPIVAETVEVGESGPSVAGFLWGQRLRIQAATSRVEDVHASKVVIGAGSRAGRIFGETIDLKSGCDVGEVTYTGELRVADHVKIAHPVKKVDKLKEPPL
jgi:cytoskeletal protein CcmA (bactofilin family)